MIKVNVKSFKESKLLKEWFTQKDFEAMSPEEQEQYLKDHPNSKFKPQDSDSAKKSDTKTKETDKPNDQKSKEGKLPDAPGDYDDLKSGTPIVFNTGAYKGMHGRIKDKFQDMYDIEIDLPNGKTKVVRWGPDSDVDEEAPDSEYYGFTAYKNDNYAKGKENTFMDVSGVSNNSTDSAPYPDGPIASPSGNAYYYPYDKYSDQFDAAGITHSPMFKSSTKAKEWWIKNIV